MQDFIGQYYLWFKALHVISVMAWMAGLLYLPRLFVYHVEIEKGSKANKTFKTMERKLLRVIMNPAMILSWIFGCLMLYGNPTLFEQGWIHVKLLFVVLMTAVHHLYLKYFKAFRDDRNEKSAKFYRAINEIPAVFMIIIVIMAIVEPF